MHNRNSLYSVLQVLPGADADVIEAAYKALMKKYHPDRLGGVDAERKAAAISHAFNVLRDPDRRAAYDAEERAREGRYRLDLANAFPDGSAAAEAHRRMPVAASPRIEPRPSHRIASWVGAAGVIILGVTIVMLARDIPNAPKPVASDRSASLAASGLGSPASDVSPAAAPVPFRDQPVSRQHVERAVTQFRRVSATGGLRAAAGFSEQCFQGQAQSLDVNDFDFCVAFDHAAGRLEPVPAADRVAARRFQPQNQVARHVRAADPIADTFSSIELRLFDIRRLADAVATELDGDAGELGTPVSHARAASRASARQAPARPRTRQAKSTPDGEFLEREGGIY